jgi:hypothetical protein
VIKFEFVDGSSSFPVHFSYHWLTEEFCGCNKQVLLVLYDGYCLSTSALYVGFISPEVCELALACTFLQAAHKKIPGV